MSRVGKAGDDMEIASSRERAPKQLASNRCRLTDRDPDRRLGSISI